MNSMFLIMPSVINGSMSQPSNTCPFSNLPVWKGIGPIVVWTHVVNSQQMDALTTSNSVRVARMSLKGRTFWIWSSEFCACFLPFSFYCSCFSGCWELRSNSQSSFESWTASHRWSCFDHTRRSRYWFVAFIYHLPLHKRPDGKSSNLV